MGFGLWSALARFAWALRQVEECVSSF